MNKLVLSTCFFLLMAVQMTAIADNDFIAEQRSDFDTLSAEETEALRQELLTMSVDTLERLYKEKPKAKEFVENAYGYGVFRGQAVNLVLYVAGNGLGVVFDNATKTPVYMHAVRGGTGPGVGYKSMNAVFVFENETVFKQFTTIGLQVSASGDATMKIAGKGVEGAKSISLVPGVKVYQLTNTGLVLQANWGATEFVVDTNLNNLEPSAK